MYMRHYGTHNRVLVNRKISLFIHYFSQGGKSKEAALARRQCLQWLRYNATAILLEN
jgi:hypothetical protein